MTRMTRMTHLGGPWGTSGDFGTLGDLGGLRDLGDLYQTEEGEGGRVLEGYINSGQSVHNYQFYLEVRRGKIPIPSKCQNNLALGHIHNCLS